jgi:hypothetical protein
MIMIYYTTSCNCYGRNNSKSDTIVCSYRRYNVSSPDSILSTSGWLSRLEIDCVKLLQDPKHFVSRNAPLLVIHSLHYSTHDTDQSTVRSRLDPTYNCAIRLAFLRVVACSPQRESGTISHDNNEESRHALGSID